MKPSRFTEEQMIGILRETRFERVTFAFGALRDRDIRDVTDEACIVHPSAYLETARAKIERVGGDPDAYVRCLAALRTRRLCASMPIIGERLPSGAVASGARQAHRPAHHRHHAQCRRHRMELRQEKGLAL
jgi:hypothetical protein